VKVAESSSISRGSLERTIRREKRTRKLTPNTKGSEALGTILNCTWVKKNTGPFKVQSLSCWGLGGKGGKSQGKEEDRAKSNGVLSWKKKGTINLNTRRFVQHRRKEIRFGSVQKPFKGNGKKSELPSLHPEEVSAGKGGGQDQGGHLLYKQIARDRRAAANRALRSYLEMGMGGGNRDTHQEGPWWGKTVSLLMLKKARRGKHPRRGVGQTGATRIRFPGRKRPGEGKWGCLPRGNPVNVTIPIVSRGI